MALMLNVSRRLIRLLIFCVISLSITFLLLQNAQLVNSWWNRPYNAIDWAHRIPHYQFVPSPELLKRPPPGAPLRLPRIQHDFSNDTKDETHDRIQRERRDIVRNTARKCWETYREYAWARDELAPISLQGADTFSGWGATLVDSLDTLWIMGLHTEFEEAVSAVARIDWGRPTSSSASFFETNIRYLGGLLAAFELSGMHILLAKAQELGHMLYAAFDTPNGLPANALDFAKARKGKLVASMREALAVPGTFSLEFTRLSQLSDDYRYYHEVDFITDLMSGLQDTTALPGLWPTMIDLQNGFVAGDNSFTLGASADSAYEYLSKMYMLLGGLDSRFETMHRKAMDSARRHLLFRAMPGANVSSDSLRDLLFSGTAYANGGARGTRLVPEVQHLGCFAGGMFAIGGRLFEVPDHVKIGEQLARGCAWAYSSFATGLMPEISHVLPCSNDDGLLTPCAWNATEARGKQSRELPLPFTRITDARYLLRPEAIESIFLLYRITGKRDLLNIAWTMFQSIRQATETKLAHSAIADVQATGHTVKLDSMESFWIAETLKYFYLIFSEPDHISLDEYVFNTEAHPLKRPEQPTMRIRKADPFAA